MKTKTERVPVMFEKELVEEVDSFSFSNRIRSRGAAIRLLIRSGLAATKAREPEDKAHQAAAE